MGAVVGVLKYTGRDKDVEDSARKSKNKADKKGMLHEDMPCDLHENLAEGLVCP